MSTPSTASPDWSNSAAAALVLARLTALATPDLSRCEACAAKLVESPEGTLMAHWGLVARPFCPGSLPHTRGWVDDDAVVAWARAYAAAAPPAATPTLEVLVRLEADTPEADLLELVDVALALED